MEEFFSDIWWLIALCAVGYMFGIPLTLLHTVRHEVHPLIEPVDANEPLPSVVSEHLAYVEDSLAEVGFQPEQTFLLPRAMPNLRTILMLLVNRSTNEVAIAVTMYTLAEGRWALQLQYVEFSTRLRSGRIIDTGNPRAIGSFPRRENSVTTHIPWIDDPLALYRVHEAIVTAQGDHSARELRLDTEFSGDAATCLQTGMHEELEAAREAGYLRLSSDGEYYRATVKGAYLMGWKQLPPFKGLIARHRHRQTRRLLAELGIEA